MDEMDAYRAWLRGERRNPLLDETFAGSLPPRDPLPLARSLQGQGFTVEEAVSIALGRRHKRRREPEHDPRPQPAQSCTCETPSTFDGSSCHACGRAVVRAA
jgi:hypothetical protein